MSCRFNGDVKPNSGPAAGIPWSADIILNDTQVSDAGVYRCMVNNPPEAADPGIGELVLSVLGECVTSLFIMLWLKREDLCVIISVLSHNYPLIFFF